MSTEVLSPYKTITSPKSWQCSKQKSPLSPTNCFGFLVAKGPENEFEMLLGKSTGQLMYFSWYSAEKTSAQGDLSVFHTDDCNSYLRGLEASRLLLFFYECYYTLWKEFRSSGLVAAIGVHTFRKKFLKPVLILLDDLPLLKCYFLDAIVAGSESLRGYRRCRNAWHLHFCIFKWIG